MTSSIPEGKNRLALETSPYLLQHADNPVDWYPWGEEAFARARAEDRPVLVSIGYSSCHWCHVMEHESFEDEEIAALMNELFVCVKVDREERPDVDEIYMTAVQLLGIGGGWPLNVFLTPDGEPIVGGTYFPPRSYPNRPGWPDVLRQVSTAWANQREALVDQSSRLRAALAANSAFEADSSIASVDLLRSTGTRLAQDFDEVNGGFGGAPKFPPHQTLQFLLRRHARDGDDEALRMTEHTLRKMARGGMYDQLGGGFHRYSVDERWLVPHFEKMLYDNAQLARVYVEAHQVTGRDEYARIAREVLDYQLREMTDPDGGFWSATDADSDGREGVYFVWRKSELEKLLGADAPLFLRAYGVSEEGSFEDVHHPRQPGEEGMNVLHLPVSLADLAVAEGMDPAEVEGKLAAMREVLFEHRASRTYPGLDDKIVTSWNALMIGAMAYAGRVLDEPRYTEAARKAADFVLVEMRSDDGRLFRTHRAGTSKIPAFLEDYSFLASALLDLYEATFEIRWFQEARALVDRMNELFWDEADGGWFHTADDGEELITRVKTPTDASIPGGNGMAALVSARLASFTGGSIPPRPRRGDAQALPRSDGEVSRGHDGASPWPSSSSCTRTARSPSWAVPARESGAFSARCTRRFSPARCWRSSIRRPTTTRARCSPCSAGRRLSTGGRRFTSVRTMPVELPSPPSSSWRRRWPVADAVTVLSFLAILSAAGAVADPSVPIRSHRIEAVLDVEAQRVRVVDRVELGAAPAGGDVPVSAQPGARGRGLPGRGRRGARVVRDRRLESPPLLGSSPVRGARRLRGRPRGRGRASRR